MSATLDLILAGIKQCKQSLALAEAGKWEQFTELQTQRQTELAALQLQGLDLTVEQQIELRDRMEELIGLNRQLEIICRHRHTDLANQLKKVAQSKKVAQAYSQEGLAKINY